MVSILIAIRVLDAMAIVFVVVAIVINVCNVRHQFEKKKFTDLYRWLTPAVMGPTGRPLLVNAGEIISWKNYNLYPILQCTC